MELWTFFEKHAGKDFKARIFKDGEQVACYTLGEMRPDILELAHSRVMGHEGPDKWGYINIHVSGGVPPVN